MSQCTREILQDYYANLVRTHSTGTYIITGTESSSSMSSDSEMDYEDPPSRPASPAPPPNPRPQASTILIDTTTVTPEPPQPPTVEQNMAYQAFQQQSSAGPSQGGFG